MIAAKQFDPVVGIDIHIIQPPGPVPPVPVPHPFIGILLDPFDFAPIIGGTVMVNGIPRATAGTGGKCIPPHIPIGGVFVKPPGNECEVFMGSSTVLADGEPLSFLGMPALSCHDIGMPPPPRLKKKKVPKSLFLPTSVVLSVPAGAPVLVGGPPTVSMLALGMKAAMAGLGKAFKKLRKLQKASRRMKALSDKVHKAAKKAMDKLGVPPSVQNRVHRSICSVTGHPVDVATGKVFTERRDFELPGPIPLEWTRIWYSSSVYSGPLGAGWHHLYDMALLEDPATGALAVRMSDGRAAAFPILRLGERSFNRQERYELFRDERGYGLLGLDHLTHRFSPLTETPVYHVLSSIEDRRGNRIEFHYDGRDRLSTIIDSAGRTLSLDYDEYDRIIAVDVPARLASYRYGPGGELLEAIDALGHPVRYEYRNRLLARETNSVGLSFYFEYDSASRCTRTWGDGGIFDHRIEYRPEEGVTRVTDSVGAVSTFVSDRGVVVAEIDAVGRTKTATYGEDCEVLNDNGTTYEYDERRNPTHIAFPDGASLRMAYDYFDNLREAWDTVGGHWQWRYDESGLLIEEIDPLGIGTKYENRVGKTVRVIRPDGSDLAIQYDQSGNIAEVRAPDGLSMRWSYDYLGRAVRIEDARGNVAEREFDLRGRVIQVREFGGRLCRFAYDGEGNCVWESEGGAESSYRYAGLNRLVSWSHGRGQVQYAYDTEGRLVRIVNEAGHSYEFELDAAGQVVREVDWGGPVTQYTRDKSGRIVEVVGPDDQTARYSHDARGRVTSIEYAEGRRHDYKYRPDGVLIEATNDVTRVSFERDLLGRIVREQQGPFSINYRYDLSGRVAEIDSSLGVSVRISRDQRTLPRTVEIDGGAVVATFAFERDVQGFERERRFLFGSARRSWNACGLPSEETVIGPDGQSLASAAYHWDAWERLVRLEDSRAGSIRFAYDTNRRPVLMENGSMRTLRVWDDVRNVFATEEMRDRQYGPAGQLLRSSVPGDVMSFSYDSHGNLIRKESLGGGRIEYSWYPDGWLAGVRRSGEDIEFQYDALGRRVLKRTRDATTRWIWSLNNLLHEWTEPNRQDSDASLEVVANVAITGRSSSLITWVFEPGRWHPMAKLTNNEPYAILTDYRGVPHTALDRRGQTVWSGLVDLMGNLILFKGDRSFIPFRLPGQYEDAETGLYYNRFRYYDSDAGMFISRDPTRTRFGIRRYGFVDDPLLMADPLGLHEVYAWIEDGSGGKTLVPGATRNGTWRSTRNGPHSEEHLIRHLDGNPDLPNNTLVIESIGQPRSDDARNLSPRAPCGPAKHNCDQQLDDFARKNKCNVHYHWVDEEGKPKVERYPRPCA